MLNTNSVTFFLHGIDLQTVERLLNERKDLIQSVASNRAVSGSIPDESSRIEAITAELTHILGKNALAAILR